MSVLAKQGRIGRFDMHTSHSQDHETLIHRRRQDEGPRKTHIGSSATRRNIKYFRRVGRRGERFQWSSSMDTGDLEQWRHRHTQRDLAVLLELNMSYAGDSGTCKLFGYGVSSPSVSQPGGAGEGVAGSLGGIRGDQTQRAEGIPWTILEYLPRPLHTGRRQRSDLTDRMR